MDSPSRAIDTQLTALSQTLKILYYTWPLNEREQQHLFLQKKIQEPTFVYPPLPYAFKKISEMVTTLALPKGPFHTFYREKQKELFQYLEILTHIGDNNIVQNVSQQIHGKPTRQLVRAAENILATTTPRQTPTVLPATVVKKYLENTLRAYGLSDWTVEYSNKTITTVYGSEKKITICKNRQFTKHDPKRLSVHEIGVHVLRTLNGQQQPSQLFALGTPHYLATEEGLASYAEDRTNTTNPETLREYAGRVLAVNSVLHQHSFSETFRHLQRYHFTAEQAWQLSARVHRAGGYVKDHIYLQGYLDLQQLRRKDKTLFTTLYVGKIGLTHLPLVKKLLQRKILRKPKILPTFLKDLV